jgi:spermidine synthase
MGMTLPVVVGAYGRRKERYDFEAGTLYGVNTLGAVTGTLVAGFFVLPWLGLLKTCVAVGVVDALVGVVAWRMNKRVGAIEDIRLARTQEAAQAESVKEKEKWGWTPMQVLIGGVFLVSGAVAMGAGAVGARVFDNAWAISCGDRGGERGGGEVGGEDEEAADGDGGAGGGYRGGGAWDDGVLQRTA